MLNHEYEIRRISYIKVNVPAHLITVMRNTEKASQHGCKIVWIKYMRDEYNLGLIEAKELVEEILKDQKSCYKPL